MGSTFGTDGDQKHIQDQDGESTNGRKLWQAEISIPESLRTLPDATKEISTISTLNLPKLSPDTTERVFPIRSVVSIDSSSSSALPTPSLEKSEIQVFPFTEGHWASLISRDTSWSQHITPPAEGINCPSLIQPPGDLTECLMQGYENKNKLFESSAEALDNNSLVTPNALSRFPALMKFPWEGPPIDTIGLSNLEDTPPADINSKLIYKNTGTSQEPKDDDSYGPNSVQSFGALIVLQELDGKLVIQITSSNTLEIISYSPGDLFELGSFCDIIRHDQREKFLMRTRLIKNECYNVEQSGPDVLGINIYLKCRTTKEFWCTMHATESNPGHIICELEPTKHFIHHLRDANPDGSISEHSDNRPVLEEVEKKKKRPSVPVELLQVLKQIRTDFDRTDVLSVMSLVNQLAAKTQSLNILCDFVIGIMKELTGFHKITIYRFDSDWNGIAVADVVDSETMPKVSEELQFPRSLSSEDLRKLHLNNKVCLSYGHEPSSSGLVYRNPGNSSEQLNMNHCYLSLRSPTPSDIFTGMPVHACMTIKISVFQRVWGVISCQSYEKDLRLIPPLQKLCWLISDTFSSNIERLSNLLPLHMQEPLNSSAEPDSKRKDHSPGQDILSLFAADYAAYSILGQTKILGKPLDSQEVLFLVEYLKMKESNTMSWSSNIIEDFPDLNYPPGFKYISSLFYAPLSSDGRDFIIFFRASPEIICVVHEDNTEETGRSLWGKDIPETGAKNFKSNGWSAVDFQRSSVLSLIYRTFTDVWQQKEAAMQSTNLMKLLLANCAHEFRTPLNAIINYLEIVLDGSLNQETRENLSRSHSASKSLVYIINDLLDLTNAENGNNLNKDEVFNLSETIREATSIFHEEARQKHVELLVVPRSEIPLVLGDQRRVRQVITNLISNAVQHTSCGTVIIDSCVLPDQPESDKVGVEVAIYDTGTGMSQEAIEALFCELEQVSNADYIQNSQRCGSPKTKSAGDSRNILGLGLALVARIVHNMNGQLSLKSEEGQGSCFKIKLQFPLPSDDCKDLVEKGRPKSRERSEVSICSMENECNNSGFDFKPSGTTETSHFGDKQKREHSKIGLEHIPQSSISPENINSSSTIIPQLAKLPVHDPKENCDNTEKSLNNLITELTQDNSQKTVSKTAQKTSEADSSQSQESQEMPDAKYDNDTFPPPAEHSTKTNLHILVAEDDPVNSSILCKRLERFGHTVHMTANGKECASAFRENGHYFNVVLMDLQMPIIDGISSTKIIRECEQAAIASQTLRSTSQLDRIPIFAVSASLVEKDRQTYIDSGFDGWIMKPIDFHRINYLLDGVRQDEIRNNSVYKLGMWENGGWFNKRTKEI